MARRYVHQPCLTRIKSLWLSNIRHVDPRLLYVDRAIVEGYAALEVLPKEPFSAEDLIELRLIEAGHVADVRSVLGNQWSDQLAESGLAQILELADGRKDQIVKTGRRHLC